jgi:pimeloyl-ACP methyl ester carboxylesterase
VDGFLDHVFAIATPGWRAASGYASGVPYATSGPDGTRVYFEDDGGTGAPILVYPGILDSIELVRNSHFAQELDALRPEFRLVSADHRGLGRSERPHEVEA